MHAFIVELKSQFAYCPDSGQFDVEEDSIETHFDLLDPLIALTLPRGFLNELVFRLHSVAPEILSEVSYFKLKIINEMCHLTKHILINPTSRVAKNPEKIAFFKSCNFFFLFNIAQSL
jgi:hypothetical protein